MPRGGLNGKANAWSHLSQINWFGYCARNESSDTIILKLELTSSLSKLNKMMEICPAVAKQHRMERMAKLRELRRKKQFIYGITIMSDDTSSVSSSSSRSAARSATRAPGGKRTKEDVRSERKIRNRESAIRYRDKRRSELEEAQQRIVQLEREKADLWIRLSKYESLNDYAQNQSCNTIAAIF